MLYQAFRNWMGMQVPRLQRETMANISLVDGPQWFEVVATWPATKAGPGGTYRQRYAMADINNAVREIRCRTRRGLVGTILAARGV